MTRRPVLLLVTALLAGGCSSGGGAPSSSPSSPPTSAAAVREVPLSDRLVKRFTMTGQPDWMAVDHRYLFVREDSGEIVAVDPRSNKFAWKVRVPSDNLCQGLGLGFGSLWTCSTSATTDSDDVVRIDLRTHRIVAKLEVGKSTRQGRLVTGFGRVWVINSTPQGSSLVGIDPKTGKTDPPIPLGILATDLAVDGKFVWAIGPVTGDLVAVDTHQRRVVRRVGDLGRLGGPSVIKADAGLIWVSGEDGTVGIDPESGRVTVEVPAGAKGFGGLVATDTDLWLHPGQPFLIRVDPTTGRPVERIVAPDLPNPGDVTIAFGSLWASCNNQSTLVRMRLD